MDNDNTIKRLAVEQRKRLIAGLLNAVEASPWYRHLSPEDKRAYRKEVMDRVGTYHDFMLDIIKVSDDEGSVINQHFVELVQQVHDSQRSLERRLESTLQVPAG